MAHGKLLLFGAASCVAGLSSAFKSNADWNQRLASMTDEERKALTTREAQHQDNPLYHASQSTNSVAELGYRRLLDTASFDKSQPVSTVYKLSLTRR